MGCCHSNNTNNENANINNTIPSPKAVSKKSLSVQTTELTNTLHEITPTHSGRRVWDFLTGKKQKDYYCNVNWDVDTYAVNSDYRKRRLSDQAMDYVMRDDRIHESFEKFCLAEGIDHVVYAWRKLDELDHLPLDDPEYITKANSFYVKYSKLLSRGSSRVLNAEALREFREDLKITEPEAASDAPAKLEIKQTDREVIANVLRVFHLRLHLYIKYEYLPRFLVSKEFQGLKSEIESPRQDDSELEAQVSSRSNECDSVTDEEIMNEEDVKMMVDDPEVSPYFYEFVLKEARLQRIDGLLKRRTAPMTSTSDLCLMELYSEIQSLWEPGSEVENKLKRYKRILLRYAYQSEELISPPIVSLQNHIASLHVNSSNEILELPPDLEKIMQPVVAEVLTRITRHILPSFRRSASYQKMQAYSQRRPTLAAVRGPNKDLKPSESIRAEAESFRSEAETKGKVVSLARFASDLSNAGVVATRSKDADEITLSDVLEDTFGFLSIKRFATKFFQEENIIFLVDVLNFKAAVNASVDIDIYMLMHRAQTMVKQYIEPGSALEVNISSDDKVSLIKRIDDCRDAYLEYIKSHSQSSPEVLTNLRVDIRDAFDNAYDDIYRLVKCGIWLKFVETESYQEFLQRSCAQSVKIMKSGTGSRGPVDQTIV